MLAVRYYDCTKAPSLELYNTRRHPTKYLFLYQEGVEPLNSLRHQASQPEEEWMQRPQLVAVRSLLSRIPGRGQSHEYSVSHQEVQSLDSVSLLQAASVELLIRRPEGRCLSEAIIDGYRTSDTLITPWRGERAKSRAEGPRGQHEAGLVTERFSGLGGSTKGTVWTREGVWKVRGVGRLPEEAGEAGECERGGTAGRWCTGIDSIAKDVAKLSGGDGRILPSYKLPTEILSGDAFRLIWSEFARQASIASAIQHCKRHKARDLHT
ncbi:hypothetical protein IMY05_C4694000700 [Salix suchowensis]|nr:hypothetical protein IMY05_C4694000700 [Salix suchowensis]